MQAFVEIAAEVAQGFRDVGSDKVLVDAMTARMTLKRGTLDTIVTTNLHADAVIAALQNPAHKVRDLVLGPVTTEV